MHPPSAPSSPPFPPHALPAWVYAHPEMVCLEYKRIIKTSWRVVGHVNSIHMTLDPGRDSVSHTKRVFRKDKFEPEPGEPPSMGRAWATIARAPLHTRKRILRSGGVARRVDRAEKVVSMYKYCGFLLAAALAAPPASYADCDRTAGAEAFTKCSACHSLQPGQHLMGPSLAKLRDRKAGRVDGFVFSTILRTSDVVWNEETLNRFIEDPQRAMPGTAMPFRGLKNTSERAALVCYLLEQ